MQEFDKHEIDTSIQLEGHEQTRRNQTPELGDPTSSQPPPSDRNTNAKNADDDTNTNTDNDNEVEPSLFNILQDNDKEEMDNDLNPDHQE